MKKNKIVIVDDDTEICFMLDAYFREMGIKTECFHCGNDAIEYLKDNEVSAVITDMYMKEGDGVELITWIKRYHQNLPIIVISGVYSSSKLKELLQFTELMGGCRVLTKPFKPSQLYNLLEEETKKAEI